MILEKDGFNYKFDSLVCSNCEGNCCIGKSGYIWVTKQEIENIASFVKIDFDEFVSSYLRKVNYKYSLKEIHLSNDNYACEFFDIIKKQCSIYDVRPKQCRSFPFWEYFKENLEELQQECPAIITN
jgi:Fe-S-cluster containining protein